MDQRKDAAFWVGGESEEGGMQYPDESSDVAPAQLRSLELKRLPGRVKVIFDDLRQHQPMTALHMNTIITFVT